MPLRLRLAAGVALLCAAALAPAARAARVPPLAGDAQVGSLSFHFDGHHELESEDLAPLIATTSASRTDGLQSKLAWMPFVPDPRRHPFSPTVLQEDVVRLRRHYRRQGFLEADIDYDVQVDRARRHADVTFLIREGEPLRFARMTIVDSTGRTPDEDARDPDLRARWEAVCADYQGRRFREEDVTALRAGLVRVLVDRGYLFATFEPRAAIDSVAHVVDLAWVLRRGQRMRLARFAVEGVTKVPERTVTREFRVQPGDVLTRRGLESGRGNLQSVSLFRRADVRLDPIAAGDTGATVRIRVPEEHARFTNLELGYVTDGAGVTGQARWTHPNFTGGARSLDAIALAQTGWGAIGGIPDKLLRTELTLTQPYVVTPLLSLSAGPAVELRDGVIDKSTAWSAIATLVYRFNALQSAALRYDYTYRRLDELRVTDAVLADGIGLGEIAIGSGTLDSLYRASRISQFIFFTSIGRFDDISRPRRGLVVKPNLSITAPRAFGNVEFGRTDVQATAFAPFFGSSNALMLRGTVGRLWPFGRSVPSRAQGMALQWFRLRDQVMTAGGASDVRGYGSRLLGPKVPDIDVSVANGDTVYSADEYLALGGLNRWTTTAELRLHVPGMGRNVYGHAFADMGRVWTEDARYRLRLNMADDEEVHYTAGGGLGYYTAVGAIRVDLGYMLNPSTYDVRHPGDVVRAVSNGLPVSSAPVDSRMRYHVHLSLGLFF